VEELFFPTGNGWRNIARRFKYIILFSLNSEIPPPDPMRKTQLLGFYGDRVFCFFTFEAKTPNFRLPAVGFWSLAFPLFACAGYLPPAGTRAPIFLRSPAEPNNHVKPNMWKNRKGKGKLKKTPIRETKVSEFFGNDRGMLLHTQRVTRKGAAK
jgi:hypothetical protein